MKISKHPGIRLKITLAFSVVFALLSIGLNLYSYQRIRQLIILDSNRYLMARAKSLLDKTEVSPVIIPLPEKGASLKVYERRADSSKLLLFQSPGLIQHIPLPRYNGVSDTLGLRVAYVSNSSDENSAELMIAVSSASLQATLKYLLLLLLFSTLLSVAISGAISFWLARFFFMPVQKIINTTKNINAGKLRERISVKETNDELQELTETINGMLGRIDQSLQQQQNFFASASHELKTPLAVMRAELEINLAKADISNDIQSLLKSQLEEIDRLQNVVQEFLIVSQIKADKLNLNRELFDLTELSLKIFNQLTPFAKARNVELKLHFDQETDDFTIKADKEKISIVLINLLDNAIKYSERATSIICIIGKNEHTNEMNITIENKISLEFIQISQLSSAFYRQSELNSGAGIGLWLCKEIISAHGGAILFKSANYQFVVSVSIP